MPQLAAWDSFYVIVASAAGALIGLQFVVMTLLASRPPSGAQEAGAAFASPTIIHFGAAFFLSALMRAPWETLAAPSIVLCLFGVGGLVYTALVARRIQRQTAYRADFEDWLFHFVLPLVAYAGLALAAIFFSREAAAPFLAGGAVLLLLFIGIHNAWDAATYHVLVAGRRRGEAN